jgi:hypothetical protein
VGSTFVLGCVVGQEAMPSSEDFEHLRGAGASNPPSVVDVLCKRWMRMPELISRCSCTQSVLIHQSGDSTPESVTRHPLEACGVQCCSKITDCIVGSRKPPRTEQNTV